MVTNSITNLIYHSVSHTNTSYTTETFLVSGSGASLGPAETERFWKASFLNESFVCYTYFFSIMCYHIRCGQCGVSPHLFYLFTFRTSCKQKFKSCGKICLWQMCILVVRY